MRLVHFSTEPLAELRTVPDQSQARLYKPRGLWLSDEDDETSWSEWTTSEDYGLGEIATEFELADGHNVLILDTVESLRQFTNDFANPNSGDSEFIEWQRVADKYQGMIITPYQWTLRLNSQWYYGWDCASGCIWDVNVLREVPR